MAIVDGQDAPPRSSANLIDEIITVLCFPDRTDVLLCKFLFSADLITQGPVISVIIESAVELDVSDLELHGAVGRCP